MEKGSELLYQLEVLMDNGESQSIGEPVSLTYTPARPDAYALSQNYPNPFNPKTTISFTLPQSGRTRLAIYDVAGRLVRTLEDRVLEPGSYDYTWNGQDGRGRTVAAGTYFYRVQSDRFTQTKTMVLVK
jgi:flagellar hook assembly protein FlgD